MSLSSVEINFSDDDHERLDRLVFDNAPGLKFPALVLLIVVRHSDGKLNQKYRDVQEAEKLVAKYPQIQDMVKAAYSVGTFRDIRNLGTFIFQNPGRCQCQSLTHFIQKYSNYRRHKNFCTQCLNRPKVSCCTVNGFRDIS